MKLQLCDIVNMYNAINGLSTTKVPQEMSYWIFKNFRIIKEHCTYYDIEQNKIINEYINRSPDGSYGMLLEDGTPSLNYKSKEAKEKYEDEMVKLGSLEVEIDPYLLDYDKLTENNSSFMIETRYLLVLDKLIK